jgi:hypothetical protein
MTSLKISFKIPRLLKNIFTKISLLKINKIPHPTPSLLSQKPPPFLKSPLLLKIPSLQKSPVP